MALWRRQTVLSSRWKAATSSKLLMAPSEMAPWRPKANSSFTLYFLQTEQDEAVVRVEHVTVPGLTGFKCRISCRKQDQSIWLKAFSRSMFKRHRSSSWL